MSLFKRKDSTVEGKNPTREEFVSRAYNLFEEYRSAYVKEWERQDENERIYRCEHWDRVPLIDPNEPRPVSPVVQSAVENVLADMMDGYPQAVIRPESPEDMEIADILGAVIKQNHDAQNFKSEYRAFCHDLLLQGWGVLESGFDPHAYNNIGMGFTRYVDCRSIMFDPQVEDIQEGRAVFKIQPSTIARLEAMYPKYKGKFEVDEYTATQTDGDNIVRADRTKDLLVIEHWWREYDADAQSFRVHMCKMAGRRILEDSRESKPEGYISTGKYPFKVVPLLRRKGSPLGIGFGDVFGKQQIYADKLDQIVMKNALMASHNKLLVTEASGFDMADLQDWSKEVHKGESLNGITWFSTPPLPQYIVNYTQMVREQIREESGANDFSRGTAGGGITSGSAISLMQEASGKRSRMINGQAHEAYKEAVRMEIEFEREYNMLPRQVLMEKKGVQETAVFNADQMQKIGSSGEKIPVEFFVSIKVERERKWDTQAQNDLLIQLVQLGVIGPQHALEHMIFEGKDEILKDLTEQQAQAQAAAEAGMAPADPAQAEAMQQQMALEQGMVQMPPPDIGAA